VEQSGFRLTDEQIKEACNAVAQSTIDDIKFAQQQIRNFATEQRKSIQDMEV
jgi:sulfopropanediol 3-dehydrogenase